MLASSLLFVLNVTKQALQGALFAVIILSVYVVETACCVNKWFLLSTRPVILVLSLWSTQVQYIYNITAALLQVCQWVVMYVMSLQSNLY